MWVSNKLGVPVLGNLLRPCNVLELFRKKQFAHRLAETSVTEFSLSLCCYSFLGALWHLFQRLFWKSSKGNILPIISFLWGIFVFFFTRIFFSLHIHKSCKPQPICFVTSPAPGKGTSSQDPNSISQKLWEKQFVRNLEASTHLKTSDRALQKSLFRVGMEGDLPINAVNSVKPQSLVREKMPKWGGGRERQTP